MNRELVIRTVFQFSLVILVVIIFLTHSFVAHYSKQDSDEAYVFSLVVKLDDLLKSIRAVRTMQREFIASNDITYLEKYRVAVKAVDQRLLTLQDMTKDNQNYKDKLNAIALLIQKRQQILDNDIQNGMSKNPERGRMISEILENVSQLKKNAISDLQQTSSVQRQRLKIIWFILAASGLTVIIMFSTIFVLLRRDIGRKTKEGIELSKQRDQLDDIVAYRTKELLSANQHLEAEMHARKQVEDSLHKLNEHIETIRENERMSISRDIHDEIGQSLTAMKLDLAWLEHKFLPGNSEYIERLNMMHSTLNRLIAKTQDIIADLRPPLLDTLGLADAIDWQIREFRLRNDIECKLYLDKTINRLNKKTANAVIRIIIEALTNISRHSKAALVTVLLTTAEGTITLEISDNGCGIPKEAFNAPTSYGLLGMQERARLCHGTLKIKSKPGAGTTICLTIPTESTQETYESDINN